jgi:hypothetical protein
MREQTSSGVTAGGRKCLSSWLSTADGVVDAPGHVAGDSGELKKSLTRGTHPFWGTHIGLSNLDQHEDVPECHILDFDVPW